MAGHFFQNWSHRVVLRARKFEFSRPDRVLRSSKGSWYLDPGIWVLRPGSRYLDPGIPGWRTDFRVWEWILAVWVVFERNPEVWAKSWGFERNPEVWAKSWVLSSFEHFFLLKIIFGIIYPLEMLFLLMCVCMTAIPLYNKKNLPYSIL